MAGVDDLQVFSKLNDSVILSCLLGWEVASLGDSASALAEVFSSVALRIEALVLFLALLMSFHFCKLLCVPVEQDISKLLSWEMLLFS